MSLSKESFKYGTKLAGVLLLCLLTGSGWQGLVVKKWLICLLGRFFSCLVAVVSIHRVILKLACRHLPGGALSSVFKVVAVVQLVLVHAS